MGSFFSGSRAGSIGGSSLNNDVMNDPIHKFIFGSQPEILPTAGPYAGQAPSLAAANGGYALNSAGQPSLAGRSAQLQATFGRPQQQSAMTPTSAYSGAPNAAQPNAYVQASQRVAAAPSGAGW